MSLVIDNCDIISGWTNGFPAENTLAVDPVNKVEGGGSLRLGIGELNPTWSVFYYRFLNYLDLRTRPILRLRIGPSRSIPAALQLELREEASGQVLKYSLGNPPVGEFSILDIDLRTPLSGSPTLTSIRQLSFVSWETYYATPLILNVDLIEALAEEEPEPEPQPLSIAISPLSASLVVGQSQVFNASASGGETPYTINWIDNLTQGVIGSGTSYTFIAQAEGSYQIYARVTDNAGATAVSQLATITVSTEPTPQPPIEGAIALASEIRGMFVHSLSSDNPNWELIAQTCADYGINLIVVEALGNNYARYPSSIIPYWPYDMVGPAITACHARGIKYYASMNVMLSAYERDGVDRSVRDQNLNRVNWLCPTKEASRSLLKALVEELLTKYPGIDGFMFDYIRYETRDMCFCDACRARFQAETGITVVNWPADVRDGAVHGRAFAEWRIIPINELVQLMRGWMLAKKRNLEFSAAAWNYGFEGGWPTYWRYWIGQDATYWIKEGWLDWVSPMMYTDNVTAIGSYIDVWNANSIAGPEGAVPLVILIDNCVDAISTPANLAQRIAKIREKGVDGWIIWRYGGPGDGRGSGAPDIRDYLSLVNMPATFSLSNINIRTYESGAIITWKTELPTRGSVEYGQQALFVATFTRDPRSGQDYWKISHQWGTFVQEPVLTTDHSIALTGLQPRTRYYYRIQSEGSIATSPMMTFVTEGPPPAEGTLIVRTEDTLGQLVEGPILVDWVQVAIVEYQANYVGGTTLTVSFGPLSGYQTPDPRAVTIQEGQTITVTGVYVAAPTPIPFLPFIEMAIGTLMTIANI